MNESSVNNDKKVEVKNAPEANALSLSETSPSCCAENIVNDMTKPKSNVDASITEKVKRKTEQNKTVDKTMSENTQETKIISPVVNITEPVRDTTRAAKDATEKTEEQNVVKATITDAAAGADSNDAKAHSHSTSSVSASRTHSFAGQALSDALNELSQSDKRNSSSIFTDTSITWVKVLNVTSFSTVSLNITWGVCVIGALSCFLLSEVYQVLSPVYPLTFVVSVGCYLNVLSAIVVYFLGRKRFGSQYYRLYQPFIGGQRFIVLQFLGVLTLIFAMIGASAHLKVFDASHVMHGVLASLGAAGVIGSTLLWLSLRYFDAPLRILTPSAHSRLSRRDDYTDNTRHARRQLHLQPSHDKYHIEKDHQLYKHHHSSSSEEYYSSEKFLSLLCKPPNRELAIVVCVMIGQFILSNAATLVKHGVPSYVAVINTIAQIVNWVVVHCHIGCKHIDGYSMFMLSLHRRLDTCVYWFLQSVYLISVLSNVALVYEGDETTPFAMLVVAALNLFSCGVYILFIRTTSFKASRTPSYSSMSEYGSIAVVVSAIGAGVFNLCVEYLLQYWPSTELEFVIGTSSWSTHEILNLCLISSQVFLLALSPFTDRLGRVIHGDAFSLFSPHFGSLAANIIQAFGWLLYVLAMLSFTLYISARDVRLCSLSTIGAILSVMCIVFAIRAYDKTNRLFSSASLAQNSSNLKDSFNKENELANPLPFSPSSPSPLTSPSVPTRLLSPQHINENGNGNVNDLETDQFASFCGPAHITFVLNNEMMLSYLIALASVMLNFVVDISLQHIWGVVEVPVERIMTMSDLLFILAVPLAHYSARDKGVHVWMPFAGSGRFVALQVLGWTMYSLHVIFTIVANLFVHSNSVSLRHVLQFFAHYRIYCSMFGLLRLTPIILITLSIAVETQRVVKCAELRLIAQDAFEYMRNVAIQAIATSSTTSTLSATAHTNTDQKEQQDNDNNNNHYYNDNAAIMQLAFRTVAEPMLQYYEIPYTDKSFALPASELTPPLKKHED